MSSVFYMHDDVYVQACVYVCSYVPFSSIVICVQHIYGIPMSSTSVCAIPISMSMFAGVFP